jgi:putative ABC transport system permease protein
MTLPCIFVINRRSFFQDQPGVLPKHLYGQPIERMTAGRQKNSITLTTDGWFKQLMQKQATALDKPFKNVPQKQVVLPFFKSVEIAVKSIRTRFFRSLITTVSLILAISFYTYIQTNSIIISGLFSTAGPDVVQQLNQDGYVQPLPGEKQTADPKERWILFLSLLVCVVGIVNTQLMAVADRFREIGTMKCLGALDRFVLRLFLIEATLQGLIGSAIGAVIGAVIALLTAAIKYGSPAFFASGLGTVIHTISGAILLGCTLSIIGVLYPALLAAKMRPVEAMKGRD